MSEILLKPSEYVQLTASQLIDKAVARGEGVLASNGALSVTTGTRTGRSPKDRFIVKDPTVANTVDWGGINQPFLAERFDVLWTKACDYLSARESFVGRYQVGDSARFGVNVEVRTELAWHQLFASNLFIHKQLDEAKDRTWTVLNVPGFKVNPQQDGTATDSALIIHFKERKVLVCGLLYAGEMKKAMFSILNYLLPAEGVLPMHCAANQGDTGDVALFFGLSGTGKTTLSADPSRFLIGDDEHGWGDDGVFNFEGGCYAKCIDLSKDKEPVIWRAIRQGSIMENVVLDKVSKDPDYTDDSLTQNTRVAYPREFIDLKVDANRGGEPSAVFFLTCDLYGVLPPLARLTPHQAAYYFLTGYTAKVGSTEVGSDSAIQPTFSQCFGAPFFPRAAHVYAELLIARLSRAQCPVYMVNTGWYGGAYEQGGKRFDIATTRAVIEGALNENSIRWQPYPTFHFEIPESLPGVDDELLSPSSTWTNQDHYNAYTEKLAVAITENFKQFKVSADIVQAGPSV